MYCLIGGRKGRSQSVIRSASKGGKTFVDYDEQIYVQMVRGPIAEKFVAKLY